MNFNPATWSRRNQIIGGVVASVLVVGALAPSPDDDGTEATESVAVETAVATIAPATTTPPTTLPTPDELHPSVLWLVGAVTGPVWDEIGYNFDELQRAADNEDGVAVSAASVRLSEGFFALFYDAPIGNDDIGLAVEDAMLDCAIAYEVLAEGWSAMDVDYISHGIELQDGCTASLAELTDLTASY